MKRYITEYANDKIKRITENELMQESIKLDKLEDIRKIVNYAKDGFITDDEIMSILSKI